MLFPPRAEKLSAGEASTNNQGNSSRRWPRMTMLDIITYPSKDLADQPLMVGRGKAYSFYVAFRRPRFHLSSIWILLCLQGWRPVKCPLALIGWEKQEKKYPDLSSYCAGTCHSHSQDCRDWPVPTTGSDCTGLCLLLCEKYWRGKDGGWISSHLPPGTNDLYRCGCGVHTGRVGDAGLCSEKCVQRCDAGELDESHHSGTSVMQASCVLPAGSRRWYRGKEFLKAPVQTGGLKLKPKDQFMWNIFWEKASNGIKSGKIHDGWVVSHIKRRVGRP